MNDNGNAKPSRAKGLDHEWFEHRTLRDPCALKLPLGKQVALIVQVPIEFFPLDASGQPFRPSGSLDRPYPDTWGYANRDYGNRVGIHRLLKVFGTLGVHATAFVDAASATQYPYAIEAIVEASWEIAASGIDRGTLHFGDSDPKREAEIIAETVSIITKATGHPVLGWQSPGQSESLNTLDLLAGAGFRYVADWVNDERPYTMRTKNGPLIAIPTSFELSDRNIFVHRDFTADDYEALIFSAFARLARESSNEMPRVLSLTVSPWVSGYPHRIRNLVSTLRRILEHPLVATLTCAELAAAFAVK